MKNGRYGKNKIIFTAALLFIVLIGAASVNADMQYASSQQCKICHGQIYNEWKESMHANALSDPIFQGALTQQKDKTICISCHAPTTMLTGDFNLTNDITKEAITCDFCHTVSGLNASNPLQPFIPSPGEIKYGQYADSTSAAHKTKYLELLTKAEFCAACHELVFPDGLVVPGTYTEWKNSDYAKIGAQCQACHMRTAKRSNAVGAVERNDSRIHDWKGGHSIETLQKAGELNIDAKTEGSKVYITTVISNGRAGHNFPTGGDSRLILEISATDKDGKKLFEGNRTFAKIYGDANGSPVLLPDFATQILNDTRIPPKGKSTNEFTFDAAGYEGDIKITGTLLYRLGPEELAPMPATKVSELSKTVRMAEVKENTGTKTTPGFEAALTAIGIIAIYLSRRTKKN